jgi:choline dehydrogenase-like flavoprotein
MIYIRGSRHDYDTWRDDYGCEGWGYTDLLPYFLRAEIQLQRRVRLSRLLRPAERPGPALQERA